MSERMVYNNLWVGAAVASLGSITSPMIRLDGSTRVESLLLKASSVSGDADVKVEYAISPDHGATFGAFDQVVTAGTQADSNVVTKEDWTAIPFPAPLVKEIKIKITGVNANPADTIVSAKLVTRETHGT